MSITRSINKPDIRGVKTVITSKCRQDAQKLKEQKENIESKIRPSIIHITIRTVQDKSCTEKKKLKKKLVSDTRVSCVKTVHDSSTDIRDKDERKPARRQRTRLIFPEMRGGILYSRCSCLHRDGLQDYCPLSQCQGRPECLVKPWPVCPPGKFIRLRHPELYPKTSDTSCTM